MEWITDPADLARARATFELYELAEAMMRQNLRRQFSGESDEEIERRLISWLRKEPRDRWEGAHPPTEAELRAIADGEGEPFPLVCTTAENVIGNLTRSLDAYLKEGMPRRKVVLATSRRLTLRRRTNLFKRAQEKGFELQQIFEREGVADRLAGSPKWCQELLGLAWKPSAPSTMPVSRRPLVEIEPVGREADLRWIQDTPGDRVLSGEPGSGKTFLFSHLMRKKGWPGLFLTGTDPAEIRDAWVEQRPKVVVVDDAHDAPDLLSRLARLRKEMAADFDIVAVTWEGERAAVVDALGVPETRLHKLELMTRDEILEVIRRAGVEAPTEILRDLVSQSANKPGLAVTIASLWKQGAYKEVLDGTALTRTLTVFFRRFLGDESTDVLACLALGGDRGMSLEAVASYLQIPRPALRKITSGLASGGVLDQVERDTLAVWPRKLRYSLIRSVFFPDVSGGHDYRRLLDAAPSRQAMVETLVEARHLGAGIPSDELRDLVRGSSSRKSWRSMAALSEQDAAWALENYDGDITEIASAALLQIPEGTIDRLLRSPEGEEGSARSWASLLRDWVQDVESPLRELIERRGILARSARQYIRGGGSHSSGLQAIGLAFSPAVQGSSIDPGFGRTVTMRAGLIPLPQLQQLLPLWQEIRDVLPGIEAVDWRHVSTLLWNWMHPTYASRGQAVTEETRDFMRSFAFMVLTDLAGCTEGKPGLTACLGELATRAGIELNLKPDSIFELLFPSSSLDFEGAGHCRDASASKSLNDLADLWAEKEPGVVAAQLARYEAEARGIGRTWRGASEVCRRIATLATAPGVWMDEFLASNVSGILTGAFLKGMVAASAVGWERCVERFLDREFQHAWSGVEVVLRLPQPPLGLLEKALSRLNEFPAAQFIDSYSVRREFPIATVKRLLLYPKGEAALTTAIAEWSADPVGTIRPELESEWRSSILKAEGEGLNSNLCHWLGVILSRDRELAFDWLIARLQEPERSTFIPQDGPYLLAVSVLEREQRLRLLNELTKGVVPTNLVAAVVKGDADIYKQVLAAEAFKEQWDEPLETLPDENWMELALLALDAGYEANRVVAAALWSGTQSQIGFGVASWERLEQAFARFEADSRSRVQELALLGRGEAAKRRDEAKAEERARAIHGL